MNKESNKKTVNSVLELQRKESEVRSLLQDMEKLITLKRERKRRWIWELIQNAKDCASSRRVNIVIELASNKLVFQHDGVPFEIEQLIALARKTSTKSIEGLDGNTGKFGTGFVTTHVLNPKVLVSGVLKNGDGFRTFSLTIDRTILNLESLTSSLENTYKAIDEINNSPSENDTDGINTKYEYELDDEDKFLIAKEGILELERNLDFTLLINRDSIATLKIKGEQLNERCFSIDEPQMIFGDIGFSKFTTKENISEGETIGLFFKKSKYLTIAFPVIRKSNSFRLRNINDQARIFRNFPLIGTESVHFPCLIHSDLFQPTEPRDGIRTLKDREDREDEHADCNRRAIEYYLLELISVFEEFKKNAVEGLHLLAESGMPDDPQNYLAQDWFVINFQQPMRNFLLSQSLVKTADGTLVKIGQAKFIRTFDFELEWELYEIVAELYPSNCPNKDSYMDWKVIIEQDKDQWVNGIYVGIEDVLKEIEKRGSLDALKISSGDSVKWLNNLIRYIINANKVSLTEQFAIYPNQSRVFKKRLNLRIDPGFDENIKKISKNIFRNLHDELILNEVNIKEGIQTFETKEFFDSLNTFIGGIECGKANEGQVSAIFELSCYFKDYNAPKRSRWFELTNKLLPVLAEKKLNANIFQDFKFEPVDKWTLKYVSMLIGKSKDIKTFSEGYFSGDEDKSIVWLNDYLEFVCGSEENRDTAFKYEIILTQNGKFKKPDGLICEKNPEEFEPLFKEVVKNYCNKGDPKDYLVDSRISTATLPFEEVEFLTNQIDNLFNSAGVEREVEEGEKLNVLFHTLNDWVEKDEEKTFDRVRPKLFPVFREKRPKLSVRAYGKDMSKIISEKGIDELKALSKLKLHSQELNQLEEAAKLAGGTQKLLDIARDIHTEAMTNEWRRKVGTAAEVAFLDAIQGIDAKFNIENPDYGKDFTIISKTTGKEYYVEIKSTIIGEESVKMSERQGITARDERHRYALCVITRPSGTMVEKEYFIENVRFVTNIGERIGEKVSRMQNDIENIKSYETDDDVNVSMDNKKYAVYVKKKIWNEDGINFIEFVEFIKKQLEDPV